MLSYIFNLYRYDAVERVPDWASAWKRWESLSSSSRRRGYVLCFRTPMPAGVNKNQLGSAVQWLLQTTKLGDEMRSTDGVSCVATHVAGGAGYVVLTAQGNQSEQDLVNNFSCDGGNDATWALKLGEGRLAFQLVHPGRLDEVEELSRRSPARAPRPAQTNDPTRRPFSRVIERHETVLPCEGKTRLLQGGETADDVLRGGRYPGAIKATFKQWNTIQRGVTYDADGRPAPQGGPVDMHALAEGRMNLEEMIRSQGGNINARRV